MTLPAPLAYPAFRAYLAGNFAGLNGMWILRVAMGWLAWDLTGSAAITGMVAFLNFAPTLVSGPVFGVLADRIDPRHGLVATQSLQFLLAVILCVMAAQEAISTPALLVMSLGMGLAASAYHPLRMTLAPRLIPREALTQAVAMTALNFNCTRMLGPAVGGWLLAHHGSEITIGLAAALFLPQIFSFATMPAMPPVRAAGGDGPPRGWLAGIATEMAEGARYVADRPMIRDAILLTAVVSLPARGALELLPVAADGLYGQGAGGFGALTATAGGGAVVAAIWLARGKPGVAQMRRRAMVCAAISLACVALLGLLESWPAAIALVAGLGFLGTAVGVSNQTIAQTETSDGRRGRVMSLWLLVAIGGTSLGAIGIGVLSDLVGIRTALLAVTMVSAIGLAAIWRFSARG